MLGVWILRVVQHCMLWCVVIEMGAFGKMRGTSSTVCLSWHKKLVGVGTSGVVKQRCRNGWRTAQALSTGARMMTMRYHQVQSRLLLACWVVLALCIEFAVSRAPPPQRRGARLLGWLRSLAARSTLYCATPVALVSVSVSDLRHVVTSGGKLSSAMVGGGFNQCCSTTFTGMDGAARVRLGLAPHTEEELMGP